MKRARRCASVGALAAIVGAAPPAFGAGEPAGKASRAVQATPLKEVGTVDATKGGFLAWLEPAQADDTGNAYLLVLPELRRQVDSTAETPGPRDVLRISADGQHRSILSPIGTPELAGATKVTTAGMALDPEGALSLLVWARWSDPSGGDGKRRQYVVSFDEEGDYRSEVEVDWRELGVIQFEAFGAGKFLLRGRRKGVGEERLAILSAAGHLEDVVGWSEHASGVRDRKLPTTPPTGAGAGQMVRGGDGRIYATRAGERPNETVVDAVRASGEVERLYTLRSMRGDLPLVGLKAAGDRLAAVYLERGGEGERFWIAVHGTVASDHASPLAVYGPAPGVPVSYRRGGSGDRFTFLKGGNFVTMSARP